MRPGERTLSHWGGPTASVLVASAFVLAALLGPTPTAAVHAGDALLPDLAMLQPDDFSLERKPGGPRRLRFSTTIVNLGPGRFDVYGSDPDPTDSTRLTKVTQRIQQGTGWVEHATAATMFYAGDGHNHWHVFGLQEWRLAFEATPNETIATGAKTGFCFWDNVDLWGYPAFYNGSSACHKAGDGTVPMGLSVGWGDEYPSTIAFQYIDMTGLPYGNYCLTLVADPNHEFTEATTANNMVRTQISITTSGVTVLAPECAAGGTPPGGTTVHVADLDGTVNVKGKSGRWEASVSVLVLDANGSAVGGATVTGNWSGAASGTVSGQTAGDGAVRLSTGNLVSGTQVTFSVTNVAAGGLSYDATLNTDPDTDSDGTTITISKP